MQVQPAYYTQSIQAQNNYNLSQSASFSSKSGDKVSISDEAKVLAEKMQESQDTNLPLEEYAIPQWFADYDPPCMFRELKLGKTDTTKEMFANQHQNEITEYRKMTDEAYKEICKKYNITKYSDFSKYSQSELEEDFKNLLSQNEGVEDLMDTLKVDKKL